jgi:hypothetical protein
MKSRQTSNRSDRKDCGEGTVNLRGTAPPPPPSIHLAVEAVPFRRRPRLRPLGFGSSFGSGARLSRKSSAGRGARCRSTFAWHSSMIGRSGSTPRAYDVHNGQLVAGVSALATGGQG